jgi:hypothetical protein
MMRKLIALLVLGTIAAGPVAASEEGKGDNRAERTVHKVGAAIDRGAHRAWHGVKKAAVKTGEALQRAGRKTAKWIDEKTG